jgi:hypothetical protein
MITWLQMQHQGKAVVKYPLRFLAIRAGVVLALSLVRGEVYASDKFHGPNLPTYNYLQISSPYFNHSTRKPTQNNLSVARCLDPGARCVKDSQCCTGYCLRLHGGGFCYQ